MDRNWSLILALIALMWLIHYAFPGELPPLDRLPEPVFRMPACDCKETCLCHPCKCLGIPYDEAMKRACSEALPLVIFVNSEVRHVDGCIVCRVTKWDGLSFNVGVIVGAPTSWERGHKGKVEQRVVAELYGPRSPGQIKEILKGYKEKLDKKWENIAKEPTNDEGGC